MSKGFTAIEMLITLAILGFIGVGIGRLAGDTFYFSRLFQTNLNSADEARRILRPMADEIRGATISSAGAYPIEEASPTSFIFFVDIDNDTFKERIRYFLDGTTLKIGVTKPTGSAFAYDPQTETIIDMVSGIQNGATPIFDYYDTNYDGTTPPLAAPFSVSDVRLVKITFIIDADLDQPPGATTVTTQISFRNLKDNY